jgi:hypothetical protein
MALEQSNRFHSGSVHRHWAKGVHINLFQCGKAVDYVFNIVGTVYEEGQIITVEGMVVEYIGFVSVYII